ncbi:unnamed protein product [Angiostrongylus costaricensis]|uniref:DNA topoisomerase (ATP-hydrolyzing) n=1 Tax=Angiostrongylus costaricensis TaxID=334426 RepID=A0A0R3PS91_ANGCS|nr:unnamed protein product [Angiostrongylus costaricensis]
MAGLEESVSEVEIPPAAIRRELVRNRLDNRLCETTNCVICPDMTIDDSPTSNSTYKNFVDNELFRYSWLDLKRSIPSVVDGLKPSQRKVIHTLLHRNSNKEIKVNQLAAAVALEEAYHHGEHGLNIIKKLNTEKKGAPLPDSERAPDPAALGRMINCWEDAVVGNVNKEYGRLIQRLQVSALKAGSSKTPRDVCLHSEKLGPGRWRGIIQATISSYPNIQNEGDML